MLSRDKNKPLVVKFDGIDGAGKTTLILKIYEALSSDIDIKITKEFGSDQDTVYNNEFTISSVLRDIATNSHYDIDDVERELLWAIMSRRNNRIVIKEKLKDADLILVDRSNLGNIAYGRSIDPKVLCVFENFISPIECVDLYIWIDTPVEICMDRLKNKILDPVESKGINFFKKVQNEYLDLYNNNTKIIRLDGHKSLSKLVDESIKIITEYLKVGVR